MEHGAVPLDVAHGDDRGLRRNLVDVAAADLKVIEKTVRAYVKIDRAGDAAGETGGVAGGRVEGADPAEDVVGEEVLTQIARRELLRFWVVEGAAGDGAPDGMVVTVEWASVGRALDVPFGAGPAVIGAGDAVVDLLPGARSAR